jgi:hypothetical protein
MRKNSRKITILAGMIAAMMVAGVAFAAWTSTSSGTGEARSGVHTNLTVTGVVWNDRGPELFPGSASSFKVTISNPNPYKVIVTDIGAGSSNLVNGSCTAATVTSAARTDATGLVQSTGGLKAIAASSSAVYTLVSTMINDPDPTCEGQTFTLPLSATLVSAPTAV